MPRDYYQLLGISNSADMTQIKQAINAKIRELQVDINSRKKEVREQAEAKMKLLLEARKILLDPESRREYDSQLKSQQTNPRTETSRNIIRECQEQGPRSSGFLSQFLRRKEEEEDKKPPVQKVEIEYSIALLMDCSGSMSGEKIIHAHKALISFLQKVNLSRNEVGLIEFGLSARATVIQKMCHDYQALESGIYQLEPSNGTPLLSAIQLADTMLSNCKGKPLIILATDGIPNEPEDTILEYADQIKAKGIRIITIGIGSDVNSRLLKKLASSPNDYYSADASITLESIYREIAAGLAVYEGKQAG